MSALQEKLKTRNSWTRSNFGARLVGMTTTCLTSDGGVTHAFQVRGDVFVVGVSSVWPVSKVIPNIAPEPTTAAKSIAEPSARKLRVDRGSLRPSEDSHRYACGAASSHRGCSRGVALPPEPDGPARLARVADDGAPLRADEAAGVGAGALAAGGDERRCN